MNRQSYTDKKGLTVKELMTTGIFSALLCIAMFLCGIPFAINPVTTFCTSVGSVILGGPISLLLEAIYGEVELKGMAKSDCIKESVYVDDGIGYGAGISGIGLRNLTKVHGKKLNDPSACPWKCRYISDHHRHSSHGFTASCVLIFIICDIHGKIFLD